MNWIKKKPIFSPYNLNNKALSHIP